MGRGLLLIPIASVVALQLLGAGCAAGSRDAPTSPDATVSAADDAASKGDSRRVDLSPPPDAVETESDSAVVVPDAASSSAVDALPTPYADAGPGDGRGTSTILVYSRTTRVRHVHIPRAVMTLQKALSERGFMVEASEDPQWFTGARLRGLAAVILVSTTGTPLGEPGTAAITALDEYVRGGGVLVGLHAASSTLYDPALAYTRLIGGKFVEHPGGIRDGTCRVAGPHPAVERLPPTFVTKDEIYVMSHLRPENQVLLTCEALDGKPLPIAWHRQEGAGRVFYTALGHEVSDWAPDSRYFRDHALPGILWALGR